jgi:glyoxylase-like metal-dependent hydrolase (beta-lactamase superfamily II)
MTVTNTSTSAPRIEGLHPIAAAPLSFAPQSVARAFLLERAEGNILVYSTPAIQAAAAELDRRGGVARHYLNHWHEGALGSPPAVPGVPLLLHEADAAALAGHGVAGDTFAGRHTVGADFEAIPIPGHTPGATAYLWTTGAHRLLFTGDTIYLHRGRWRVAVLEDSDRRRYAESLELIRELDFDVLVPWVVDRSDDYLIPVDAATRRTSIDTLLGWVRRGG